MESTIVSAEHINAYYGDSHAIKDVNIKINRNEVVAMMGPSGCGKTTFLRCINRMHELIPNARAEGVMKLDGEDVYKMNAIYVRSKIGMVFQRPNPF
ncbi:MAG: ATP-binding cassette domain-containing protein, partial [Bacteroidetes bacterium]|nr:ATP-binding cassette domain-containing protein [Bacteroidota bacterium]